MPESKLSIAVIGVLARMPSKNWYSSGNFVKKSLNFDMVIGACGFAKTPVFYKKCRYRTTFVTGPDPVFLWCKRALSNLLFLLSIADSEYNGLARTVNG